MISQYMGQKNDREVARSFFVNLEAAVGLAVLFSLASFLLPEQILGLYTQDRATVLTGAGYLFLLGGIKIGKQFFAGSLLGMLTSSFAIDLLSRLPVPDVEPLLAAAYGGVICGLGLGIVFVSGTSTGGSDILVRLLNLKFRDIPIGQISIAIDLMVSALTGIVFQDITKALYTGVSVYLTGKVVDAVVYRFDYSKVALIISREPEAIARSISQKLERGATFLYGEGSYTGEPKKVVLTAVKRQQLALLTELVTEIDANAFIIVQEAHQVLGDGFKNFSKNSI